LKDIISTGRLPGDIPMQPMDDNKSIFKENPTIKGRKLINTKNKPIVHLLKYGAI
jgi:hypothetical protein